MLIETGVLSCLLMTVMIAFRSERRRSADMHAKVDAALASARDLELVVSSGAAKQEERPTLH